MWFVGLCSAWCVSGGAICIAVVAMLLTASHMLKTYMALCTFAASHHFTRVASKSAIGQLVLFTAYPFLSLVVYDSKPIQTILFVYIFLHMPIALWPIRTQWSHTPLIGWLYYVDHGQTMCVVYLVLNNYVSVGRQGHWIYMCAIRHHFSSVSIRINRRERYYLSLIDPFRTINRSIKRRHMEMRRVDLMLT